MNEVNNYVHMTYMNVLLKLVQSYVLLFLFTYLIHEIILCILPSIFQHSHFTKMNDIEYYEYSIDMTLYMVI